MANLHSVFSEYNRIIRLSDDKRAELMQIRDNLRARVMSRHLLSGGTHQPYTKLEFQSQGSVVMDTIIVPVHEDYDLDDGIYFIGDLIGERRPVPAEFHRMVIDAIGSNYDHVERVIDKATCVRVVYKAGFHIDLPVYYTNDIECPDLADKTRGWLLSNPVEFIAWFEDKIRSGFEKSFIYESALYDKFQQWITDVRKKDVQMRRIVRYMKSWGDLRREEMPCGLIMSILVANNYSEHERDDISLMETMVLIEASLRRSFACLRPTTPKGEDLLASYKNRAAFMNYLGQFIQNAKQGIQETDPAKACKYWQRSLGDRFPCQLVAGAPRIITSATSALAAGASTSRPWSS